MLVGYSHRLLLGGEILSDGTMSDVVKAQALSDDECTTVAVKKLKDCKKYYLY